MNLRATAQDVMTADPLAVAPSTPLARFARICAEEQISGCPVLGPDGRLVGIVSRTDLLRLARLEGRVEQVMERRPVTVAPSTPLLEVARLLAEHRIHRVLVEEGGRILGIVTSLDVIAHLASGGESAPGPTSPGR